MRVARLAKVSQTAYLRPTHPTPSRCCRFLPPGRRIWQAVIGGRQAVCWKVSVCESFLMGERTAPWALSFDWLYLLLDIQQLETTLWGEVVVDQNCLSLCHQSSKVCRSDSLHPNSTCHWTVDVIEWVHGLVLTRVPLEDVQHVLLSYLPGVTWNLVRSKKMKLKEFTHDTRFTQDCVDKAARPYRPGILFTLLMLVLASKSARFFLAYDSCLFVTCF